LEADYYEGRGSEVAALHDRETYYEMCVVCEPPSRKKSGAVFACKPSDIGVSNV